MSLVRFSARNHPQQTEKNGARDDVDDRRTPDAVWQIWNDEHRFTLDAAATAENSKCDQFCHDGLVDSWAGHRVWCNPPYSNIGAWVEKAWDEMQGTCERVVMLLPANRCEQSWWQRQVEPYRDRPPFGLFVRPDRVGIRLTVLFLPGRMRFDRPGWTKPAKGDRPPFGLCLLIWSTVPTPPRGRGQGR